MTLPAASRNPFGNHATYEPAPQETSISCKKPLKIFISIIGVGGSCLYYMTSSRIPTWVSAMGIGGFAQFGVQSVIDITSHPVLNCFNKNRIKRLCIPAYWWAVQWYKNTGAEGQEKAFEFNMAYLSVVLVSTGDSLINRFKFHTNIEGQSQPHFSLMNADHTSIGSDRVVVIGEANSEAENSSAMCCSSTKVMNIAYVSGIALSTFCLIASLYADSLDAETLEFWGYLILGGITGHCLWGFADAAINSAQKRIDENVFYESFDETCSVASCVDKCIKGLYIFPIASLAIPTLMFQDITPWYSPALIGASTGVLLRVQRNKLREIVKNPSLIRGIPLEGWKKYLNNFQKVAVTGTELGFLTWFYSEIMKMGKLNQENFGPFLPAYVTGYSLNILISHLLKKYGTSSKVVFELFSLFAMNHYLFALGFFWILNDKNVGMGNEYVTPTTVAFSATGFGLDALAMGLQAGLYDTEVISEILKAYDIPTTEIILMLMWLVGHLKGSE